MQSYKTLFIFLCLLPLQSLANNNQITSNEQLRHDYEVWKMRHKAISKIRNISGLAILPCFILAILGGCVADYAANNRNIILLTPSVILAYGSYATGIFSTPTFFISLALSLFSTSTLHELRQKLKKLGYEFEQDELIELKNSITSQGN